MEKNDNNSFENYEKRIEKEFENSTIFNSAEQSKPKKHKTNNSYIKLLCGLLCFLIVVGASIFSVVKFMPNNQDINEPTTTENEASISLTADANVSLDDMKNASKDAVCNVSKIVINNKYADLICVPYKSENDVAFKLSNVDKKIPINDDFVTSFYDEIFSVSAISKLDDKWTEKDCGLESPEIFVTVTMADNSEFTIKIGDKLGTNDGYYYLSTSVKDGIYIVDSSVYETFSATLESLVDLTLIKAIEETDTNASYFVNGSLSVFDSIEINGENFNLAKLSYKESDDEVMAYYIDEPVKAYADEEKIKEILSPLSSGFSATTVSKLNPTEADIKKYGLDNPYLEINYVIDSKTYNLKFSKVGQVDANYTACMINDVPVIYSSLSSTVSFIDWSVDSLRFNLLYLKDIETFKTLTAYYNGKSYKYELSFNEVKDEDDTTENVLTAVLNSAPIDSANFKTAYQRIAMVSASKYLGENITLNSEPTLKFEIELENGNTDVITFTKYNENYYLHKLNGIGDELIAARTVDSLITNFEYLRKGETVESPNYQQ